MFSLAVWKGKSSLFDSNSSDSWNTGFDDGNKGHAESHSLVASARWEPAVLCGAGLGGPPSSQAPG